MLAIVASGLIILFQANVSKLIPLYAIGVFLSFTLSQSGMARRWWRIGRLKVGEEIKDPGSTLRYEKGWRTKLLINGVGGVMTAVVMLVFAVTKFRDGAWIIVLLVPTLVFIFFRIHRHYRMLARRLSLDDYQPDLPPRHHRVIIPVGGVHQATLQALRYARLLGPDVTAVHVSIDAQETEKVQRKWLLYGEGVRLEVLESPYRMLLEPLLAYIEEIYAVRQPGDKITIIVPEFVSQHWWTNLLHTQTATWLRLALLFKPEIVITDVPYLVD